MSILVSVRRRHTFGATPAHPDGVSPQHNAKVNLFTLVKHFFVVPLEHNRLFHQRADGRVHTLVVGEVGHVGIFEVCMEPCYLRGTKLAYEQRPTPWSACEGSGWSTVHPLSYTHA
jgi:hypothetical protein